MARREVPAIRADPRMAPTVICSGSPPETGMRIRRPDAGSQHVEKYTHWPSGERSTKSMNCGPPSSCPAGGARGRRRSGARAPRPTRGRRRRASRPPARARRCAAGARDRAPPGGRRRSPRRRGLVGEEGAHVGLVRGVDDVDDQRRWSVVRGHVDPRSAAIRATIWRVHGTASEHRGRRPRSDRRARRRSRRIPARRPGRSRATRRCGTPPRAGTRRGRR